MRCITSTGSIDIADGGYIATAEIGHPYDVTVYISPNENIKEDILQNQFAKLVQVIPQKRCPQSKFK
ncbi:hypothetical protein ACLM5H_23270 [Fredinandcohnia humi]